MNINDFEKLQAAYTLRGIENSQLRERVFSLARKVRRATTLLIH
jgi:hypothetical protein